MKPKKNKLRTAPKVSKDPAIGHIFRQVDRFLIDVHAQAKKALAALEGELQTKMETYHFRNSGFIQAARVEARMSQRELADETGINPSTIGNYEAGWKTPTINDADLIYKRLFERGSMTAATALIELAEIEKTTCEVVLKMMDAAIARDNEHKASVLEQIVALTKEQQRYEGLIIDNFAMRTAAPTPLQAAISAFVTLHPDFDNSIESGNGPVMKSKLDELGLPYTSENLAKAFALLKDSGSIVLKKKGLE